jgi:hypothetical protein
MPSEEVKTQSLLMNIYSVIFARKIREELADVAKANCYGCEIDHPSQTHHSCLIFYVTNKTFIYLLPRGSWKSQYQRRFAFVERGSENM